MIEPRRWGDRLAWPRAMGNRTIRSDLMRCDAMRCKCLRLPSWVRFRSLTRIPVTQRGAAETRMITHVLAVSDWSEALLSRSFASP